MVKKVKKEEVVEVAETCNEECKCKIELCGLSFPNEDLNKLVGKLNEVINKLNE
jgi:hypothetical protein